MALPSIPALGALGKSLGLGGAFAAGSRALPRATNQLRNAGSRVSGWLGRNTGRAGAGAGGAVGGFGLAGIMDRLGIEDDRLRTATALALVLAVVVAIGQLVDIQLGGS